MTALLLTALFVTAALVAFGVLVSSWQQHGADALALRGKLAACPETVTVRYAVREVKVLRGAAQGSAKLFVLPVRQAAAKPVLPLAA
jgi:hypothetical protein